MYRIGFSAGWNAASGWSAQAYAQRYGITIGQREAVGVRIETTRYVRDRAATTGASRAGSGADRIIAAEMKVETSRTLAIVGKT